MFDALSQRFPGYEDWTIALLPVLLIAYLTPVLIAVFRKHRFTTAIGLINFFLGWTVVGWLAAVVWAVNKDLRETPEDPELVADPLYSMNEPSWNELAAESQAAGREVAKKCQFCAEEIKAEALVCRYCGRDVAPAEANGQQSAAASASSIEQTLDELKIAAAGSRRHLHAGARRGQVPGSDELRGLAGNSREGVRRGSRQGSRFGGNGLGGFSVEEDGCGEKPRLIRPAIGCTCRPMAGNKIVQRASPLIISPSSFALMLLSPG